MSSRQSGGCGCLLHACCGCCRVPLWLLLATAAACGHSCCAYMGVRAVPLPSCCQGAGLHATFLTRPAPRPPSPGPTRPPLCRYALQHLHTRLVVVMGHTNCGAIKASVRRRLRPPPPLFCPSPLHAPARLLFQHCAFSAPGRVLVGIKPLPQLVWSLWELQLYSGVGVYEYMVHCIPKSQKVKPKSPQKPHCLQVADFVDSTTKRLREREEEAEAAAAAQEGEGADKVGSRQGWIPRQWGGGAAQQ